jgi:signal transduction histidine kinase/ligand-binding sensor domain-containing protein
MGFGQFKHTRWTADDGAPTGIYAITQTPDGYLWLGTEDGLVRFDGVVFERIPAPAGSTMERAAVFSFLIDRTGALYVGYAQSGGLAVYRNGRLLDLGMPTPPASIDQIVKTPDGALWVSWGGRNGGARRLWRLFGGRWEPMGDRLGLPDGMIGGMRLTRDGTLWLDLQRDEDGLLVYLRPGGDRLQDSGFSVNGEPDSALDRKGQLWLSDRSGIHLVIGSDGKPDPRRIAFPAQDGLLFPSMAFDPAGGMWGTTEGAGIFYIPAVERTRRSVDDRLQRFGVKDGLTSDVVHVAFVDREGNVWFGNDNGLDQFRAASVWREPLIANDPAKGMMMARSNDGSVYVLTSEGLYLIAPRQAPRRFMPADFEAICRAYDQGIWALGSGRMTRIRGDRSGVAFALPPGADAAGSCAEDRLGRLWVRTVSRTLLRRDASGWRTVTDGPEALRRRTHWDLVETPGGDIAFNSTPDMVTLVEDREIVTRLDPGKMLPLAMIAAGNRDMFVGANGGLLRVRDGRVLRLEGTRFAWLSRPRTLVQTPLGDTWLLRNDGLYRMTTAELDRAFDDPRAPLDRRLFDTRDGLQGPVQGWGYAGPQLVAGGDSRLWLLTRAGVVFIDLTRLKRNLLPPPVAIRSLTSGGKTHTDPGTLALPAGTHSLEIAYTALSLTVPRRVQFRYRLEGVDDDWVDPGARRIVSYANLGPGSYRFQVIASNDDGVWNQTGATLDFTIQPTFFQSWPFRVLVGLALLGLLWLAYSFRLRAIAHRIRQRMAERIGERERIARELHDTLLQSVQSLTLRFQLAVDDLPAKAAARPALEEAIDRADRVIAEGRDRVRDLRPLQDTDIKQIIADIVARQSFGPGVSVAVRSSGTPRPLDPLALDEVSRIASEAIFNIWRHAEATIVTIDIAYGLGFTLRFTDNGKGIDPHVLAGGKPGHFGLAGMRERAAKLSGELAIRRLPAGGTEVLLTVPGSIAYKPGSRWLLPRFGNSG